jgi:hypothetical protein
MFRHSYLETGGESAVVRPWVWIAWLFVGPTIGSIAFQWYIFIAVRLSVVKIYSTLNRWYQTRTLVRTESIITQLVFDHSLRIRMKAEVAKKSPGDGDSTVAPTPDGAATPDANENQEPSTASGEETLQSSSTSVSSLTSKGKQKAPSPEETPKASEDAGAGNLVGKINNLVTTDLANITNARDFLYLGSSMSTNLH